jgi:hypothetical protein
VYCFGLYSNKKKEHRDHRNELGEKKYVSNFKSRKSFGNKEASNGYSKCLNGNVVATEPYIFKELLGKDHYGEKCEVISHACDKGHPFYEFIFVNFLHF